ncbi:MAG: hypothetical protein KDB80_03490 [Planctomycetes bacterium]|nr:hypothetical protein [Planctomycetota bacterium]
MFPFVPPIVRQFSVASLFIAAGLTMAACSSSGGGSSVSELRPDPNLAPGATPPGLVIEIEAVEGGSVPGTGAFRPGDTLSVRFSVKQDDGQRIALDALDRGNIMISGPTFNYHRVVESISDLRDRAVKNSDGTYTYKFASPLPATYMAPLNDTDAITLGEMTGEALLDGTYTVGIEARKEYMTAAGESVRDPGNTTADFLVGGASTLQPREVVTLAHCNRCHGELSVHGDNRNKIGNCLLCHTTGAEDKNVAAAAGGTPGVSIDFKVMIHKIHSGKHLPSVLGVTTKADGSRDYTATPKPYEIVGHGNSVNDFSHIALPVWPSLEAPTLRDSGYTALGSTERGLEDTMRSAPVSCDSCHGDPDGSGPIEKPAQGDLAFTQPTITACASCHDDWVPEFPYTANMQTMPAQRDDSACTQCHKEAGTALDVVDAHRHPMVDPATAPGIVFTLAAPNGGAGVAVGQPIEVAFTVEDDAGNPVALSGLSRFECIINGPTSNPNLLYFASLAVDAFGAGPNYSGKLPETVLYENLGETFLGDIEQFTTMRAPHWNTASYPTSLSLATATATTSSLIVEAPQTQNFVDVAVGQGSMFARDDFIAVGGLATGEIMKIQFVDGDRLWFSSPATQSYKASLVKTHAAAEPVVKLDLAAIPSGDWSFVDAMAGVIQEGSDFGDGFVVATYTTDFVVPVTYRGSLNDTPSLGQRDGDWRGMHVVDGTYTIGMYASRSFSVAAHGESTSYREASKPTTRNFLLGAATTLVANDRVESAEGCYKCHVDIQFHGGGRRGLENCLLCHGIAGAEDRPQYVAANAPETPRTSIEFRQMLHRIHHGKELTDASDYVVNGFGSGWPNNFSEHRYDEVGFPYLPAGTRNCAACHGDSDAWYDPRKRAHPDEIDNTQAWTLACLSCHNDDPARFHVEANTAPSGGEACEICHGIGEAQDVRTVHSLR